MSPLAHAKTQLAIRQQLPRRGRQIVKLGAVLAADFEQIFEPGGGHESRSRAFAFEQRVGRDRRTMDHIGSARSSLQPRQNHLGRLPRMRAQLEGFHAPVIVQHHEIRESPPGVHPDAH